MEQSPSWEANRFSDPQEIPCILRNPKVHYLIQSALQARGSFKHFLTWHVFTLRSYQHLAQLPSWRTTPCRLSAITYSIYSQLPCILETVRPSATWGRAMPWWQGPTYHGMSHIIFLLNREFCTNYFVFSLSKRQRFKVNIIVLSYLCALQYRMLCAELCCQVFVRETQIWQFRWNFNMHRAQYCSWWDWLFTAGYLWPPMFSLRNILGPLTAARKYSVVALLCFLVTENYVGFLLLSALNLL
jgi:hypothetical protein